MLVDHVAIGADRWLPLPHLGLGHVLLRSAYSFSFH